MTTTGNRQVGFPAPGLNGASLKLVAVALAVALAAPAGAGASDRVERRAACREEARRNVRAAPQTDLELYRRVVKRRQLYIQDCMLEAPPDGEQTGAVSVPLPPERPRGPDASPEGAVAIRL